MFNTYLCSREGKANVILSYENKNGNISDMMPYN